MLSICLLQIDWLLYKSSTVHRKKGKFKDISSNDVRIIEVFVV